MIKRNRKVMEEWVREEENVTWCVLDGYNRYPICVLKNPSYIMGSKIYINDDLFRFCQIKMASKDFYRQSQEMKYLQLM